MVIGIGTFFDLLAPLSDASSGMMQALSLGRRVLKKVPAVTIVFWIIKVLTTALGESSWEPPRVI